MEHTMLKILVINKVTREQYVCQDINHLQQLLNAGADEIVRYLVDLTYKPSWVDSEWIIELSKVNGALIEGIDVYEGKNIIVLDYVGRRRIIYDDIASAYDDNLLDFPDILSSLTSTTKRIKSGKYIAGYEFFFLDNISPKKSLDFLGISPDQATRDNAEYLTAKVKQILHVTDTEEPVINAGDTNHKLFIYTTPDGGIQVEPKYEGDTFWMSQKQIAELFGVSVRTIIDHTQNIFNTGELLEEVVTRKIRVTTQHGAIEGKTQTRSVNHYNLDMVIAVGYRVNSKQATSFRIWSTNVLSEYLIKGFALDDKRLKNNGDPIYQQELLDRIRDIRSSEKVAWVKMKDLFATSIDYNPDNVEAKAFFATVQNKLHWAAHGHTAAEIIYERVDSSKPNAGMTNFAGHRPTKTDAGIAKSYLDERELLLLNKLTSMYLDFAEVRAIDGNPMAMSDWITKLDEFIKVTERELLTNKGRVSHDQASRKAAAEYQGFINLLT